jgi:hypothetical protein
MRIYYAIPFFLCKISEGYIFSTKLCCTIDRWVYINLKPNSSACVGRFLSNMVLTILNCSDIIPMRTTEAGAGRGSDNHLLGIMPSFKGALFSLPLESIRLYYFISFYVPDHSNHTGGISS